MTDEQNRKAVLDAEDTIQKLAKGMADFKNRAEQYKESRREIADLKVAFDDGTRRYEDAARGLKESSKTIEKLSADYSDLVERLNKSVGEISTLRGRLDTVVSAQTGLKDSLVQLTDAEERTRNIQSKALIFGGAIMLALASVVLVLLFKR